MEKHSAIEAAAAAMESDNERIAGTKARVAATQRCETRFAAFLNRASSPEERASRLRLIEDNVREVVADISNEYRYDNPAKLAEEVLAHLKTAFDFNEHVDKAPDCKECGDNPALPDEAKCSDCMDKDDSDDDSKESSAKTACGCGCDGDCDNCGKEGCECGKKEAAVKVAGYTYDLGDRVNFAVEEGEPPVFGTVTGLPGESGVGHDEVKVLTDKGDEFATYQGYWIPANASGYSDEEADRRYPGLRSGPSHESSTQKESEFSTGYQSETIDLGAANDTEGTTTGLGEPSPKMDERSVGEVGDNLYGLDEMDVPESTRNQKTHMDADQKEPEFTSDARETGKSHPDVAETIEADKEPGAEIVGPATETFSNPSNTADPVTSSVAAKWGVLEDPSA